MFVDVRIRKLPVPARLILTRRPVLYRSWLARPSTSLHSNLLIAVSEDGGVSPVCRDLTSVDSSRDYPRIDDTLGKEGNPKQQGMRAMETVALRNMSDAMMQPRYHMAITGLG